MVGASEETTKMVNRSLTRRLEQLEARIEPSAEPVMVEIVYVAPDGTEELESRVEMTPSIGPAWLRRLGGQRAGQR